MAGRGTSLGALLLVGWAGCTAARVNAPWPHPALPADAPPPQGELLLDSVEVELQPGRDGAPVARMTVHRIIRTGPAYKNGPFVRPYDSTFERLLSFRVRTIAPDGTEHRYAREAATDSPLVPSYAMYSDRRALKLDVPAVPPGSVIEEESVLQILYPSMRSLPQMFGHAFPETEVRFVVHAPADWDIDWHAELHGVRLAFEPEVTTDGAHRTWTWARRNMPAVPHEPRAPASMTNGVIVRARLRTWREGNAEKRAPVDAAGLSAAEFALMQLSPPTPAMKQLALSITSGETTDEGRTRKIYTWVRDRVAYCAVEIGLGGYQPHAADEVATLRYGDCKDKANLMRALLEALGIESRLVAIWSHDGVPHGFALPTLDNFNHAIIETHVGDAWLLSDPTSRVAAFGSLPASDEGAAVLPLSRSGSPLATAPTRAAEENRLVTALAVRLEGTSLEGTARMEASGAYADLVRGHLLQHSDPLAAVQKTTATHGRLSRVELERGAPTETVEPVVARASVELDWHAATAHTFVQRVGDLLGGVALTLPEAPRTEPLIVGIRGIRHETLSIELPATTIVESMPEPIRLDGKVGTFELRFERHDRTLVLTRELTLHEGVAAAADYEAVRSFFESIRRAETMPVVFHRTSP